MGLALAFLSLAMKPELHRAGVVVPLALYAPTVLHRMIGLLRFAPVEKMSYAVAGLELAMLVAAAALWFAGRSH